MTRLLRFGALFGICMLLASCGSSGSSTGAPSTTKAWTLSGHVKASSTGAPLTGATVTVMDGPAAQRSTTTDNGGAYTLVSVPQAGMSVQASAAGYTAMTIAVNLTADTTQDFALVRLPAANLQSVPGSVTPTSQPGNTWLYAIPGINQGDGCAGSVSGTATFADNNGTTVAMQSWSLPAATIIRPGQQFTFNVTLSNDAAFSTKSYYVGFQYVTVACP